MKMFYWKEPLINSVGFSYHLYNPMLTMYWVYITNSVYNEIDYQGLTITTRTLNNTPVKTINKSTMSPPIIKVDFEQRIISIQRHGAKLKIFPLIDYVAGNPAEIFNLQQEAV